MQKRYICAAIGTLTGVYNLLFPIQPVRAATLSWHYAIDSFSDGYNSLPDGSVLLGNSSSYEFYGLAIAQDGSNLFVALNANMPLEGIAANNAQDGVISWGDLFFNFSGDNFNTASSSNSLYAIRFAPSNNSNAPTLGVYNNVMATSVTLTNSGFNNLTDYNQYVQSAGGTPSLADLSANTSYFNQTAPVLNVIDTGNFVTNISWLNVEQLNQLDLNFSQYGATGTQTIGFSFDAGVLPTGNFIASIFAECANDGMVLAGDIREAPEPVSILGAIAGIGLVLRRRANKRKSVR
jgi:hypothetical protein